MLKLPAKIKLITVGVQVDLNCMASSVCSSAFPLVSFRALFAPSTVAAAVPSHVCWFTLDDALALWLEKDGLFS